MARNDAVDDTHEITRWLSRNYLEKDDEGKPVRDRKGNIQHVDPRAYALREGEEYLSVTSINHFNTEKIVSLPLAVEAFRMSLDSQKLPATSAFGISRVGDFKQACRSSGENVRVVEEPVDNNPAHVAVRRYPPDNQELLNLLAATTFAEAYTYSEIKSWAESAPYCAIVDPADPVDAEIVVAEASR